MRPHIPHLDVAALPWEEILDSKAMRKVLSRDPATGSDTSYVKLPPNWQGPAGAHYHSDFEEALMLAGDVDLNGNDVLVAGSYLYRPGGIVHGWVDHSTSGAEIIIKMGTATDLISVGKPQHPYEYDHPSARKADGRPHIVHLKTAEAPWQPWPAAPGAARFKSLSRDTRTGAETMLIELVQGFAGAIKFAAEHTWEWVVTAGGMSLADGTAFNRFGYSHRSAGASADTVIAAAALGCTLLAWRD